MRLNVFVMICCWLSVGLLIFLIFLVFLANFWELVIRDGGVWTSGVLCVVGS